MARVEITETVLRPHATTGALQGVSGASVTVNTRGGGAATVYAASTGGTTVTQPLTTRSGRIEPTSTPGGEVWVEPGSYDLVVTSGGASVTERFEAASGVSVAASPVSATPLYPEDFGARGDVVVVDDAVVTSGSAVVTSASGAFASATTNMRFSCGNAATGPAALHTTIQSVQSANQITLAQAAGVSISPAICSYATDDTAALQDCLTAASETNGTAMLSKWYATTAELQLTGNARIVGTDWFPLVGDFASALPTGQGPGVPWIPPYLEGCGLHVMASGLRSALAIPVQGLAPPFEGWAIRFAAPFWSTGHGIYAPAHPTNKGNGIQNVQWRNIGVFGVDGDSYAYWLRNFFQVKLDSLRYWGGGGYRLEHDNGLWAFGNSQFNDCTGKTFLGGSANAWTLVSGAGGAMNQISTVTLGANAVNPDKYFLDGLFNGRTIPPTTSGQKLIDAPTSEVNGLSLIGHTWDNAGQAIQAPTLPTEKGPNGGGGLFVDPGGMQIPVSEFGRIMIGPGYGGSIRNPINHVQEVSANTTITSSGDAFYVVDATAGARTITLPARAGFRGMKITVKKRDASANTVSVAPNGTDQIDGVNAAQVISTQGDAITVVAGTTGWFIVDDKAVGGGTGSAVDLSAFLRPAGGRETMTRMAADGVATAPASGTLRVTGVALQAGDSFDTVTFVSSAAAATPTAQWACLIRASDMAVLEKTNDDAAAAWAGNDDKTFMFTAPVEITESGLYYVGIVTVAGTNPSLRGSVLNAALMGLSPVLAGTSTTGLTNPASLGATAAAVTATGNAHYALLA